MKKITILVLLICGALTTWAQVKKNFKVFDAILYKGKPDLKRYGFSDINLIYEDGVISTNYHQKDQRANDRRFIDAVKVKKSAGSSKYSSVPVCLDVEHWNIQAPGNREYATEKYVDLINSYRAIDKKSLVSVFHYGSISQDIYDVSNVVYPAYYTHGSNPNVWEGMVRNSVKAMKKMGNKPIYAFVWPQYNPDPNDSLGFQFLDTKVWRKELELIYELCDGVVIWTHYSDKNGKLIYFDKNMPWFIETQAFIKSKKIK